MDWERLLGKERGLIKRCPNVDIAGQRNTEMLR